ncbi:MAG: hypothetical protein O2999_15115 [Nitrospirae bacterium]|nr:hypothetical protein [Nitrospirota bacterium]MDA1305590.1 hypothetical protein [Nitrospirota bacterium]
MQFIRCTGKLLKEAGFKPNAFQRDESRFSFLGQWHANLIYIDGRKSVIFVNDRTLFNFIAPDINRAQIRELPKLFESCLSCVISSEAFPENVKYRILGEYEDIGLAKSSSRSVLGALNNLAFHYKNSILNAGGVHSWKIPDIIHQMNRMPMQPIKYQFPIEEIRTLYGISS